MDRPFLKLSSREDVGTLYPEGLQKSFYGITVMRDKTPIGIIGLYFDRQWVLFARVTNELRPYKLTIWRASKEMMKAIKIMDATVYAVADPSIPGSDRLLLRMGFKHLSKDWYVYAAT